MWGKRYQGKRLEQAPPENAGRQSGDGGKKKKGGFWRDYGYLLITAAAVVLVFRVLLQLAYVPTGSMETTIPTNSLLVAWQLPYLVSDPVPERGNIVTFWSDEQGKILVKRVIGLPNEEVGISNGYVSVDGERLEEPYLDRQGVTASGKQEAYQVPEGCLLTLGDNRTGSFDSRMWNDPYVPCGNVRSRVLLCIPVRFITLGGRISIPLPEFWNARSIG